MIKRFIGKKALLVEDDPISLRFLGLLLKKLGFITISANNGNQAIELFKNNKIDIVLLDIQVPGPDGFEVCRTIKNLNHSIPVIAQSANDIGEYRERCLCAGCDDYVAKPIIKEELTNTIIRLL